MNEATIVEKPTGAASVGNLPRVDSGSARGQGENEFKIVLQTNGRAQITADADLEGLEELRASLDHIESTLKRRIAARKPKQDTVKETKKDEAAN